MLLVKGGLYLDVDAVPRQPLEEIFQTESSPASALSIKKRHIFQAILRAPRGHPVIMRLVQHAVFTPLPFINCEDPRHRSGGCRHGSCTACTGVFTRYFYEELSRWTGAPPAQGLNPPRPQAHGPSASWELFREECSDENAAVCDGRFDRYGHCCAVWRGAGAVQPKKGNVMRQSSELSTPLFLSRLAVYEG